MCLRNRGTFQNYLLVPRLSARPSSQRFPTLRRHAHFKLLSVTRPRIKAGFVEPMLLLRTEQLPESDGWMYEIKLDGYRAQAIKTLGKLQLRSRNNNDFSVRYSSIANALSKLPNETVVDGEIVALDQTGKPSFNALQNYQSTQPWPDFPLMTRSPF